MPTVKELERFLASESKVHHRQLFGPGRKRPKDFINGPYQITFPRWAKMRWLRENPDYARAVVTKHRGVGRHTWAEFLAAFDLAEQIVIVPTNTI